jgi:hypothetical protein
MLAKRRAIRLVVKDVVTEIDRPDLVTTVCASLHSGPFMLPALIITLAPEGAH